MSDGSRTLTDPSTCIPIERTPENDEIYRYIRSEIQFELGLINARVNWLVASQAFLFVPLTIGTRGTAVGDSLFFPLIPLLGVVLCLLVLVAILAAVWRSRQWRAKCQNGAYSGQYSRGQYSIVMPHTPAIPVMGMVGAIGVPAVLALTWLYLLIAPPVTA
ncbi:hypothetical protein H0I76_03400 [Limibaculum sp. M0105]|uniref:Uncharacterized protein n=1 Tax=Thermohalobaculum xanthum TaxID=2753746 RepID=A0A8J7M4L9_9RHOB|nr:hypothetical protein [Thermohalobaculum xanthum]MBK0398224.1 hypothetical protein [Thermohalobaculum xanthum]